MPAAARGLEPEATGGAGFEAWRCQIREACGRYNPELPAAEDFRGWARLRNQSGFDLLDVACNVDRIERNWADTRRDDTEYFYLILQLAGRAVMLQNDHVADLSPGDIALIDSTRPSCFHYRGEASHQISVHVPRRECGTYLGFQPEGGMKGCSGSGISRLAAALFTPSDIETPCAPTPFEALLGYDLIGAAFAPDGHAPAGQTAHAERLFLRLRDIIKRHAVDSEFGSQAAAEAAGISVRYMQKLCTDRGTSFTAILEAARLERASLLLRRRRALGGKASVGEIAFSCGFASLPHFSRTFRSRFGHAPREHAES